MKEAAAAVVQMDLDEWELLPDDDGLVETNSSSSSSTSSVLELNYFICPPTPSPPEINNITTTAAAAGGGGGGDQDLNEFDVGGGGGDQDHLNEFDVGGGCGDQDLNEFVIGGNDQDLNEFVDMMGSPNNIAQPPTESAQNVWKRGIAAICSFAGVAAAFCLILSNNTQHPPGPNQNLTIHNFIHHPTARARITCGGYYAASSSL